MPVIAIILLSLGSFNAVLAIEAGTCTQGDADRLYGGVITLVLYLIGGWILSSQPLRRWHVIALVPATIVGLWHSIFAVRFAWVYFVHDISACTILEGTFFERTGPEMFEMDGNEANYALIWLGLSFVFWASLFVAGLRTANRPVSKAG